MSTLDDLVARRQARSGSARGPERVLETLQRDAVTDLVGVMSGFWSTIEEQVRIAALAGHDFSAAQEDRVAIMALAPRALELATRYRAAIELAFAHWREAEPRDPEREGALELMSEGDLEIHLAGQQITELLDHQFLHPLTELDERLDALAQALGLQGRRLNPLRPAVAVTAFVALFDAEDLTPSLRRMVFQQFDKRLPKTLGDIYAKANATLAEAAFAGAAPAPRAMQHPRSQQPAAPTPDAWVPEGGTAEVRDTGAPGFDGGDGRAGSPTFAGGVAEAATGYAMPAMSGPPAGHVEGQPLRYRDIVREQLHAWRRHGGSTLAGRMGGYYNPAPESGSGSESSAPAVDGQFLATEDMFNIASLLQGDDPAPYARALAGEDKRPLGDVLRSQILGSVRQLGLDPEQVRFSADEEDAIDLVGILFQSLVEANDLLQRARAMYGKLVMPYLKVALVDDSLFNRRSHPARKLLDALTEACDGNSGETARDQETLDHAERAVDRVVAEFQDDAAIFELAASELRDQLDQQRKRAEIAERRIAESIYGRERLQLARRAAEELVASRLQDRPVTAAVAHFLDEHWRHHLTQTWLREGPEAERYHLAVSLGDAMLQVDADAAQVRGAAVAAQLLALQVPLGECYSSCGLDAASAREAMARIIAALAMPDTARQVHTPQADEVDEFEQDDSLPPLRLVGGTDTLEFDPAIAARMRRLKVGQGVRLIDRAGHETAARIAWISPLTSRFLLVNRRGIRKLVVSPEELAAMVAAGRAVVRSVDAPFDEAMKQLWQRLNHAPRAPLKAAANGG
ncbi:DUF1631 domain-containing protein [Luteimonas yindakuii]|uniref:DUF1631 domain-containing protein n=1 Tax=Luteimonas yindakuii TaxID=2565782 RepID=A0A4Z1R5B6_9GAMM|nr:DUF1631 family protein [Luteimonas yindakuii]TKS54650.1 DUF1631 domain-containing protein [Luteimonas yindakuii]